MKFFNNAKINNVSTHSIRMGRNPFKEYMRNCYREKERILRGEYEVRRLITA